MVKRIFLTAIIGIAVTAPAFTGGRGQAGGTGGGGLGGIDITIGFDNHDWDTNTYIPTSAYGEQLLAWRRKIQKDYNFTMREKNLFHWDYYAQQWSAAMTAGKPLSQIFYAYPHMILPYHKNNWLAPMPASIDFTKSTAGVSWEPNVAKAMTWGGKTYGFVVNPGSSLRNEGLIFNKRLLKEASIDPEAPYDMQKAGTWTWDALREMLRKLTRDIDNDGKIDRWGISMATFNGFAFSNGAMDFDYDDAKGFVDATGRPEFLEALNFYQELRLNYEGGSFRAGTVAFYGETEEHLSRDGDGTYQNYGDDWGWVVYPKGPRATDYCVYARDDVFVIPSFYTAEQVEKFMYAFQLWHTTPPDAGPDAWKQEQYHYYRDPRAVDETLALMRSPKTCRFPLNYLMVDVYCVDTSPLGKSPQELIETGRAQREVGLVTLNKLIGK